ncbi:MAG: ATP-binding protein [Lentisphaerales bacterium]|nr:ATP-binding protein [Lentisphaerales bacterium]
MDFDELEKNLDKLMSLDSIKVDPAATSIVNKICSSLNTERHFAFESESSQPTLTLNKAGYVIKASEATMRVMAFERENLTRINFLNLIHPDNKNVVIESLPTDSHPALVECPIKVHNEYKWFQIMFIHSSKEDNFRLLITDINEFKLLESDYQHQSDFISKVIEHIPVGIFCREPNGQFILWSQKCEEMFGYPADEVIKKKPSDIFSNETVKEITDSDDLLLLEHKKVESTITLGDDETSRTIRIIKTPFLEDGQPIMFIGICEDISQKLELEKNNELLIIEKEEQRVRKELENIISRSDMMIYNLSLTPEPHITYISPNSKKLTGYSSAEFIEDPYLLLCSLDSKVDKYLKNLTHDSCPLRIGKEYPYLKQDGNTIWLRNDATLEIKDGHQQLIGSCINITETKEMEAEKNTAIDATRIKSEFLAHMSHEIRTPINGVLGLNSLLLKTCLNEEQKYYVELIHKSASSLLEIINDILDISKIESGKLELEMREFNLHKFLNETLEIMEVQAKQKGLRFDIQLGLLPLRVVGDSKHLGQIIRNLVNNALKFTKEGYISIKADEVDSTFDQCVLEFEIKDSGIGIPKDKLDSIFNTFTQATDSISRQYGGSGLGLSICKKLIELMNGSITVKSNFQKGTSFIFQVSLGLSDRQMTTQIDLPINITESLLQQNPDEQHIEILIVEDNDINQLVLSGLLKKLGKNKITCANNGQIGLDKFKKGNFDLVFMDCQMPVMDGFAATRAIRQLDSPKKNTPIIAITANAMATALEECISAVMSEFFTKPIQEDQLKKVYQEFTSNKSAPTPKTTMPKITSDFEFDDTNLKALEDPQLVMQVINSYDSAMDQELEKLQGFLDSSDLENSKFVIHSIQGLAGNIGAVEVFKKAKDLSKTIKQSGFSDYTAELDVLISITESSKVVLKDFLDKNQ